MKRLGLIGKTLKHSFSKKYFTEKFEQNNLHGFDYQLFPLDEISEFSALLKKHSDLIGLNVTIPYKESVVRFLDELDESAAFGAVNTIKVKDGRLIGYNTDTFGFENSINKFLKPGTKALILGTGGASKAVEHVFKKRNIGYKIVSRSSNKGQLTYKKLTEDIVREHKIIVNATPVGTFPQVAECPNLPYKALTNEHLLYDLVYNPKVTLFLKHGTLKGCITKNGLEMLYLQAEKAWEIWNSDD